MLQNLI